MVEAANEIVGVGLVDDGRLGLLLLLRLEALLHSCLHLLHHRVGLLLLDWHHTRQLLLLQVHLLCVDLVMQRCLHLLHHRVRLLLLLLGHTTTHEECHRVDRLLLGSGLLDRRR